MLVNILLVCAVLSWLFGAMNLSYTTGNPAKTHSPNWLCLGLFFAGLALWIVPLF